jgi:DNA-binding NarL/FixJ family response regulator
MSPLAARITACRQRFPGSNAGGPPYPHGLSQREVKVIRLIAVGSMNK